jgi:hypothetical protein
LRGVWHLMLVNPCSIRRVRETEWQ